MLASTAMKPAIPPVPTQKRRPGRPPVYVFTKPDAELSENERRLKGAVLKRRIRQNRSYHRKKHLRQLQTPDLPAHPFRPPPPLLSSSRLHAHSSFLPTSAPPPPFPIPALSHPLPALLPLHAQSLHPPASAVVESQPLHALPSPSAPSVFRGSVAALTSPLLPPNSRPALSCFSLAPNVPDCGALTQGSASLETRSELPVHQQPPVSSHLPTFQHVLVEPLSSPFHPSPNPNSPKRLLNEHHVQHPHPTGSKHLPSSAVSTDEEHIVQHLFDPTSDRGLDAPVPFARHPSSAPPVSNDFVPRLDTIPPALVKALHYLTLFPQTFSVEAAQSVLSPVGMESSGVEAHKLTTFTMDFMEPLVNSRLLERLPSGRYVLKEVASELLKQEAIVVDMSEGARRFVDHFMRELRIADTNSLASDGQSRMRAMKMYEGDRANMQAALTLCKREGRTRMAMQLLTHSATVMRYSVPPRERVTIFSNMLAEMEAGNGSSPQHSVEQLVGGTGEDGISRVDAEARMLLALGEAYFDLLAFQKAAAHLSKAIGMMATAMPRSTLCVSSSILALLLLAELRISERQFSEASKLLGQALRALREANLQKSTFAVCSLLSLGAVYNAMDDGPRALHTVQTALDVLKELGFEHMPIYADGLRALGSVHLSAGDAKEAQRLFFSALNIMEGWMARAEWQEAPFQHCTHLEIFLIEAIAQTYLAQQRHEEARKLMEHAREQRRDRGLQMGEDDGGSGGVHTSGGGRLFTRHLY